MPSGEVIKIIKEETIDLYDLVSAWLAIYISDTINGK
jgi:hypothetical protein